MAMTRGCSGISHGSRMKFEYRDSVDFVEKLYSLYRL